MNLQFMVSVATIFVNFVTTPVQYKFLPMTEFEPQTSGIGYNRSTN